ncbi:hypothetical protein BDQ17DRAFT_1425154 [Cyathus striatus]|nr:hypothetical protein BDQ17DRAFT_1425154 [Cyathus striatus]
MQKSWSAHLIWMLQSGSFDRKTREDFANIYFYIFLEAFPSEYVIRNQLYLDRDGKGKSSWPNPSIIIWHRKLLNTQNIGFVLDFMNAEDINNQTRLKQADTRMRKIFHKHHEEFAVSKIHAVCAAGMRICFYEYDRTTGKITPDNVSSDNFLDVMEEDGCGKLHEVVAETVSALYHLVPAPHCQCCADYAVNS